MANISFDDGVKTFEINNDPNRVIKFNPSDLNLLNRLLEAEKNIKNLVNEAQKQRIQTDKGIDLDGFRKLINVEKEVRKEFNRIFGAEDYDVIVFGTQSLFSISKGKTIIENFIDGLIREVQPMMNAEQDRFNKNVNRYKSQYDRKPTNIN